MLYQESMDIILLILPVGDHIAKIDAGTPIAAAVGVFEGTTAIGSTAGGLVDTKSNVNASCTNVSTAADVLSGDAIAVANTADIVSSYISVGAIVVTITGRV